MDKENQNGNDRQIGTGPGEPLHRIPFRLSAALKQTKNDDEIFPDFAAGVESLPAQDNNKSFVPCQAQMLGNIIFSSHRNFLSAR